MRTPAFFLPRIRSFRCMPSLPAVCLILSVLLIVAAGGCFAPVNLVYEDARMLGKGEVELLGSYSRYAGQVDDGGLLLYNFNLGIQAGLGLAEVWDLKLDYEHLRLTTAYDVANTRLVRWDETSPMHYLEIENKISLYRDHVALGIPLGYYLLLADEEEVEGMFILDPRVYLTYTNPKHTISVNLVPKIHLWLEKDPFLFPGISLGLGLSTDLDKWVVRPEVGYDGYFSIGIGAGIYPSRLGRAGSPTGE
jgi:hypothetical protein